MWCWSKDQFFRSAWRRLSINSARGGGGSGHHCSAHTKGPHPLAEDGTPSPPPSLPPPPPRGGREMHSPENWECSMLDQLSRLTALKLSFRESMLEHQSEGKAGGGRDKAGREVSCPFAPSPEASPLVPRAHGMRPEAPRGGSQPHPGQPLRPRAPDGRSLAWPLPPQGEISLSVLLKSTIGLNVSPGGNSPKPALLREACDCGGWAWG